MSNDKKTELSPPWQTFFSKLDAMFGLDPEIKTVFDEDNMIAKLIVDNPAKVEALAKLLPSEKVYGNVRLKISVIPSEKARGVAQLYKTVFNGNPVFENAVDIDLDGAPKLSYVIFKAKIIQYFNDNIADAYGNTTTLCQEIAKEIFPQKEGVYYCTENIRPGEFSIKE